MAKVSKQEMSNKKRAWYFIIFFLFFGGLGDVSGKVNFVQLLLSSLSSFYHFTKVFHITKGQVLTQKSNHGITWVLLEQLRGPSPT